jgi:hypothetical protein
MSIGILLIGSLAWDSRRAEWRRRRLLQHKSLLVEVPIRYGRCSRSRADTYTMVFTTAGSEAGQGLLFPCLNGPQEFELLWREATELWKAEDGHAREESICSGNGWGAVGLLPKNDGPSPG